jgi:hypothetical protein
MYLLQVLSVRFEGEQQGRPFVIAVSPAAAGARAAASSLKLQYCIATNSSNERLNEET